MLSHIKRLSLVWLIVAIASLISTVVSFYSYQTTYNHYFEKAKANAIATTNSASEELDQFVLMLKPLAETFAKELSEKNYTPQEIEQLIKEKKPVEISGFGVAYLPYKLDKNSKLFARNFFEQEGKETMIAIEKEYDYTKPKYTWFWEPIKKGAHFLEPYFGQSSKTILAEYSAPIYKTDSNGNKEIVGIVFANQSVEHLQHILDTLFMRKNGYWYILTAQGKYLAHPQSKYIHKGYTIYDTAQEINNPDLANTAKEITAGKSVVFQYNNEINGLPVWLISHSIKGTPWSLVGIFDQGQLDLDANLMRKKLIHPSIAFLLFVIFTTLFAITISKNKKSWWLATTIISLGILIQIIWVWCAVKRFPHEPAGNLQVVESKTQLYEYLEKEGRLYRYGEQITKEKKENIAKTIETKVHHALYTGFENEDYIPTGIFINNLQFTEANQLQISAYVWQRYTEKIHDDVPRGLVFPQASDITFNEASRTKDGKDELISWELFAKINQFLTYTRYPFDVKSLRLKLWSKQINRNIALVPDLDSYQVLNPRMLPGINPEAHLLGWQLNKTYFGYEKLNYTSNFGAYSEGPFGIYNELDISDVPQFYFEIIASRNLIDTLVSDLLPIAVIAVLLFAILLLSSEGGLNFIGWLSSVFFATIFAQIRFRSKIPPTEVVYLESFYFILYCIILILLALSIAAYFKLEIPLFKKQKQQVSALLYWPAFLGSFAIITLWYLY